MRKSFAFIALLCTLARADAIGGDSLVDVDAHGRLTTRFPGAEVMLGAPWFSWEGGSSRFSVTETPDDLTLLFHFDVLGTAWWSDLTLIQSDDGIVIVGSHSSGIWEDVCESYASWNELLACAANPTRYPLAYDAVQCVHRAGMDEHWRLIPVAKEPVEAMGPDRVAG